MPEPVKADRRLYYNADKTKLVEEGDPSAATLAYPEGDEMSAEDVKRLGAGVKQVKEPPENKQVRAAPETKSR